MDSLHAWAMKPSVPGQAVAAFDGTAVNWGAGEGAVPHRNGDDLLVEVKPRSGDASRHPARYFLGHRPIEQHLVELPGGRLQALPIGFDTTAGEWFDIFAGDPRQPSDWGHWTNRGMNANSQCLYCHTTGFEKGYDAKADTYASSWAEAGVGCEACHGAGSRHVEARRRAPGEDDAYRPPRDDRLLDLCATCHSLRRQVREGYRPGDRFLDFFEPVLLDGPEYHADGQIHAESYEWASFLQSRKNGAGIRCLDCHDAHAARLRREGNELCLGCHEAKLGSAEHSHHAAGSEGARCVDCHMPVTVYMARDPRRDHSFSIPDPQTTVDLGVPNACDRCHAEEGAAWAAARVREWFGESEKRAHRRRLAATFAQARVGEEAAAGALVSCLADCPDPVRRASAARLLAPFAGRDGVHRALRAAAVGKDDLIRWSAVVALAGVDDRSSPPLLLDAAADPVRAVRLEAAWALRAADPSSLPGNAGDSVRGALSEWIEAMEFQAEHAEAQHTLGVFHDDRGEKERAEAAYRRAIELAPLSVPPRYNLALLLAGRGATREVIEQLERVRELDPTLAAAAYALGVAYGSDGRWREAVEQLTGCLKIDPRYPGALYDLTHAYVELGEGELANVVLEAALDHPGSRAEALRGLIRVNLDLGDDQAARRWAAEAVKEDPDLARDPRVREILGNATETEPPSG